MAAEHWRYEGMSGPERVWHEKLCRKLGVTAGGPILDQEGSEAAHELLQALASPSDYDNDEQWQQAVERLGEALGQHQRRVEDQHAERLGLPPRPR